MIRRLGRQCGTFAEPLATPQPVLVVFVLVYILIIVARSTGFSAPLTVALLVSTTAMIGVALRHAPQVD